MNCIEINIKTVIIYIQILLSKPDDARYSPSGLNFVENISPSWPSNAMIDEYSLDVRTLVCVLNNNRYEIKIETVKRLRRTYSVGFPIFFPDCSTRIDIC